MKIIGLDVHRSLAQVAVFENGELTDRGRIPMLREQVLAFARSLDRSDEVVLEATGKPAETTGECVSALSRSGQGGRIRSF